MIEKLACNWLLSLVPGVQPFQVSELQTGVKLSLLPVYTHHTSLTMVKMHNVQQGRGIYEYILIPGPMFDYNC